MLVTWLGFKMFKFTHSLIHLLNDFCVPGTMLEAVKNIAVSKNIYSVVYLCWATLSLHLYPNLSTLWTIAHQVPLSMGFPRQECWSGLPFPSPGDLPNPGIQPVSLALAGGFFTAEPPRKPQDITNKNPQLLGNVIKLLSQFHLWNKCNWKYWERKRDFDHFTLYWNLRKQALSIRSLCRKKQKT